MQKKKKTFFKCIMSYQNKDALYIIYRLLIGIILQYIVVSKLVDIVRIYWRFNSCVRCIELLINQFWHEHVKKKNFSIKRAESSGCFKTAGLGRGTFSLVMLQFQLLKVFFFFFYQQLCSKFTQFFKFIKFTYGWIGNDISCTLNIKNLCMIRNK